MYNDGSILKFQVIQKELDLLVVKLVLNGGGINKEMFNKITKAINIIMGGTCNIDGSSLFSVGSQLSLYINSR